RRLLSKPSPKGLDQPDINARLWCTWVSSKHFLIAEEKRMGERIGNLNRGLLKSCFGIFMVMVFGLAIGLISGVQTFASMKAVSPALVAPVPLPKGAGPCGDKSKRYADCGNGTVTDTATGLIWLKKVDCFSTSNWDEAKKAAGSLKNGDC